MYLDYSKLEFDKYGNPEKPELVLKTMSDGMIGVIPGAYNIKLKIKFSEPSEIEFDVPAVFDGEDNWIYESIGGFKKIYTEHYGVYMTLNPSTSNDGISEVKHVKGYSLEKMLDNRKFFLEEGTFKFYDQTNAHNSDTIIGRILEIAVGWTPGYIAPSVAQKYRTFDQYDEYLLSFVYGDAQKKFRCVFVFDPYERSINVYDADAELSTIPIYLDFDNLLDSVGINEVDDDLKTAISPYGADDLDIRSVNPIGTNWIYDFSHFISNGDIPTTLANKIKAWEIDILSNQSYYNGLVSLRASESARLLLEQTNLAELQNERETLVVQQSVTIQALAMETTDAGKARRQAELDTINASIASKDREITAQNSVISAIQQMLDPDVSTSYAARINAITSRLSIKNYFTASEYETLSMYIIETDVSEESFVATSEDLPSNGSSYALGRETMTVSGSNIQYVDMRSTVGKRMYSFAGGAFSIRGSRTISGDVIRGTCEENSDGTFVLSLYAGMIQSGSAVVESGMITMTGSYSSISSDVHSVTEQDVTTYEGTTMTVVISSGTMYITVSVSDFQKYSVSKELFDYASNLLAELATPTYEFSVDSGNFLFADEFEPFRNQLELGKGVYLNINGKQVITPYIIEFTIDFEDESSFSLTFSNRFKKDSFKNSLKDMLDKSYSSSRSFDAGKHLNNMVASETSQISQFITSSLEAAKNTILAASNQSVVIDGAGIHIGGDSQYQMRIVDRMIAITDDNWQHAKMAIGLFNTPDNGVYFGVNAEVIAGKLIVGNELIIDTGNGHFTVDQSGVYIDSTRFYIRHESSNTSLDDTFSEISDNADALASRKLAEAVIMLNDGSDPDTAVYYSATIPTGAEEGDLWYAEATIKSGSTTYERGKVYRYQNRKWLEMTSQGIVKAIEDAKDAQDTADSKVMFYRQSYTQSGAPTIGAHSTGDLWYNTATTDKDGYLHGKLYRCNGTKWELVEDSSIKENKQELDNKIAEFYSGGYLSASKLSGVISAQQAKMKSAKGNVLFDSDGFWLLNTTAKNTATKAIWMNSEGILFGSGKATDDPGADGSGWTWTTAISHDGITAKALAGKTISGLKMFGGQLFVGPKKTNPSEAVADWNFVVDSNGNLTARNGTFYGTVQGAAFKTASGTAMMDSDYKFKADYLNIKGLNVNNNFIVDSDGTVTVKGKITMNSGSSINWNNVTETNAGNSAAYKRANTAITDAATAQGTANTAVTNAATAQSRADSAYTRAGTAIANAATAQGAADGAKDSINALIKGIGYTYIDGQYVISPHIIGGDISGIVISGCDFTNSDKGAYMRIGSGNYGDLYLYGRNKSNGSVWETFRIYDDVGSVGMYFYGTRAMTYNAFTNTLHFNVGVSGISTTAKFG